ncbi:MAG: MFS transporter [Planctomycetota bacterium]|jgi:MFS family permease
MAAPADARRLPRNVVLLGLVSFFTDLGSEMVVPLLPAFVEGLGGGALALSRIEGIATAIASVLRLLSGTLADRTGRHRPFLILGYGLGAVSRPLLALASAPWHVGLVRATDRVGKGLRGAPRDALLAASIEPERRAAAFGLHRAMDHAGAFAGPLIALVLLHGCGASLTTVFACAALPGLVSVALVCAGVREVPFTPGRATAQPDIGWGALARFLVPLGLFTLGTATELLLLWKAREAGLDAALLPLVWVGLHGVKAALAARAGVLADRIGRIRTVAWGWLLQAGIYAGLGTASGLAPVLTLIAVHGVRCALTEGAESALVAEFAPKRGRGRAFGTYHLMQGVLTLGAAELFGRIWELHGAAEAFGVGAAISVVAALTLVRLRPPARRERADETS